jgi:hypothetical protein
MPVRDMLSIAVKEHTSVTGSNLAVVFDRVIASGQSRLQEARSAMFAVRAAIAWLGAGIGLFAQSMGTGIITGRVTDATGAVVPDAKVTATDLSTGTQHGTLTNSAGVYALPALQVGRYKMTAGHQGFKTVMQQDLRLDVDSTLAINFQLEVGSAEQSVTVTEAPPPLQTSSAEMGSIATGAQVSELALNGRNFTQLLSLGTGVASQQTGRRMGVGQEGNPLMSVNGGRITNTKFTYDGIIAMDTGGNRGLNLFPPMDAVAEVEMKTSNYTADSGSYGYGMVNLVTKTGGNQFHGDLYEVNGNAAVDARNFFDNQRAPFNQNFFGFTVGGPFYIPHHYNSDKNKSFFFVSESWNLRQGPQIVSFTAPPASTFTAETVDANQRQGIFTGLAAVKDPTTGAPFPNNIIPSTRIDPNATTLLSRFYPLPDRNGNPNFVATPDATSRWREDLYRFDQSFAQNVILTLRYAHDNWYQDQGIMQPSNFSFPTGPGYIAKPGWNVIGRLTWSVSPTTVNVFTYGFSRNGITQYPIPSAVSRSGLSIAEVLPGNKYDAIPDVTLSGFGTIGVGSPTNNANNTFEWKDDLTHIMGNHSLKFGLDFLRIQKFVFTGTNSQGAFTFNGSATGNPVADLLLGDGFNYTEASLAPNGYFFANSYEMYAQDDWKIRRDLTLNLGLRWTIMAGTPDGREKYNHISDFSPQLYNPANAPVLLADGEIKAGTGNPLNGIYTPTNQQGLGLPPSLKTSSYVMPGPRLGFAWSPFNSQNWVVRGGYGIFYSWDNNSQEALQSNVPFTSSVNISNPSLDNPGGGANKLFPPNLTTVAWNFLYPTVQQWSFSVQRALPGQVVITAAYVGNHATHEDQTFNLNQPQPNLAVANGAVNVNTVRPYLGYGNITWDTRGASARYNGLQLSAVRRFENGLSLQASYTWSKSIAIGAGQNPTLQPDETGLASLDQTHNLTLNWVYELPFFRHSTGVAAAIFGGWETSGNATFSSGFPFTVTITGDRAGVGGGTQRPNVVGSATRLAQINEYFDVTAFALPALGTFGNEGVDTTRGPGISDDFNMNFYRNVTLRMWGGEGQKLRIGAEFFNIFNHANFSAVGAVFGSATFGHVTAAIDPREVQFSARLTF